MKKSSASVTVGSAARSHSNAPSAIVIFFVMRILPSRRRADAPCSTAGALDSLAYPTSVLQPALELNIPLLRSTLVIFPVMVWGSADAGVGDSPTRRRIGSILALP